MQQRVKTPVRAAQALAYVYFVSKVGSHVTGVARVNDPKTVELYRTDPAWSEVSRDSYRSARFLLTGC